MNRIKQLLKSSSFGAGLAGGAVVAALGLVAIATGLIEAGNDDDDGPPAPAQVTLPAVTNGADGVSIGEVYERAAPAVAFVEASRRGASESPFGLPLPDERGAAEGSGFLFDDDLVLTNAHVVEGADSIEVSFGDGDSTEAELVGADTSTDVAVLRVDGGVDADPLPLGDSEQLSVGDAVVAIGNPFGLDRTVTAGIVSALQREIRAPDGFVIRDVIQTDASINPGNSGGPLLDAGGNVIGINSQIATAGGGGSVGVGFAVPVNTARDVAEQILETGAAEHPFLGITGTDLSDEIVELLNLEVSEGALIVEVVADSPAGEAGLRGGRAAVELGGEQVPIGGDIITAVDGESVGGMDDVITAIRDKSPGDEIELEIVRGDDTRRITMELIDRPRPEQLR